MAVLYRQSKNAQSFFKELVNNIATSTLVTYQIQHSAVCVLQFTLPQWECAPARRHQWQVWCRTVIVIVNHCELWDVSQTRSPIQIASFFSAWSSQPRLPPPRVSGLSACCFSPALHQPHIPLLHWPHNRCVTDSGRLLPSPFSFTVFSSTFFPFPSQSSPAICHVGAWVSPDYHVRKRWPRSVRPAHTCQAGKNSQAECGQRRRTAHSNSHATSAGDIEQSYNCQSGCVVWRPSWWRCRQRSSHCSFSSKCSFGLVPKHCLFSFEWQHQEKLFY